MPFLRQSTIQSIRFGPFLDATDGVTEEVALTITQALRRISKDGGDFAQSGETGNSTHDENGWYFDNLTAADTDTVGELLFYVQDPATHLPVWMRWWVLEEAVYDALYGAAATGPLQSTVAGRTLDVNAAGEAGLDMGNVSGVLGQANVGWVDANSRVDVGQFLGNVVVISTGLPDVNVASQDNIDFGATQKASIQTELDASLVTIHLDHLFAVDYDPASKPGVATALLNELIESDAGVSRFTANALEQSWTVSTRVLTANTNLAGLTVDVTEWNGSAVAVPTVAGVPEVDVTHQVGGLVPAPFSTGVPDVNLREWLDVIPSALSSGNVQTEPQNMATDAIKGTALASTAINKIADGVWDENIVSAHGTADTAGLIVSEWTKRSVTFATAVVSGSIFDQIADDGTATYNRTTDSLQAIADAIGGTPPTAAQIADAVWDEDIVAAHGTVSTGGLLLRALGASISARSNNPTLDAILGVGDSAGRDLPEQVWLEGTRILTASTNFNDISTAEVNTQVDLALADIHLDHLLAVDYNPASKPGVATALLNELIEDNGGVSRFTSASLTQTWSVGARILTAATNITSTGGTTFTQTGDGFLRMGVAGVSLTDLGGMSTAMKAEVNVEVLDVMDTDTHVELAGVPAATSTIFDKVNWMFALSRNKLLQTATVQSLRNDGDSGDIATASVSDAAGTATRGEFS